LHQFLIGLFLLGMGWNFLFTGSTTLVARSENGGADPILSAAWWTPSSIRSR